MDDLERYKVHQATSGWIPVRHPKLSNLSVMSIGFLLKHKDDSVVWRGPKKHAMIRQFLFDVDWQNLDYLIIDTPPGTSDEHLAIAEFLIKSDTNESHLKNKLLGAIIVTTPQWISLSDVRKEINFCRQVNIPMLGIIENMSGYVCPNCNECTPIFSKGGGQTLAKEEDLPFLGKTLLKYFYLF